MSVDVNHATAADGTRIWYDVHGAGEPLVLIHGQSLDHEMWDGVYEDLAERHRVVRVDLRGTGGSDAPLDRAYSMELLARDVLAVLDDLGVGRAHVYGFSMGGKVAQTLAAIAPRTGRRTGARLHGSRWGARGGASRARVPGAAQGQR